MASVRRLKSGRWQVQIRRFGAVPVTQSFSSKAEADRFARGADSEVDRGVFMDRSEADRTTLADLIDRYLSEVTPAKKSASKETQRLRYLKRELGAYASSRLLPKDVAAFRDKRLSGGASGATVRKDLNSLSHVLDTAIKDWGLPLPANPVSLVRRPKVARGRDRRLSRSEEEALLSACKASRASLLAPAAILALETAMRLGELLALEWRHVDLRSRVATLVDTKNGDSRQVPLSTKAAETIRQLPRNLGSPRLFWTWARTDSFEHAWARAVAAAGIEDLRFHDLRHEATSRLFEKGLNMMEVSTITGHKSLQMLKRYTHLRAADLVAKLG